MQLSLKHPEEIISFLTALTGDRQTGEVLLQSSEQSAKVYLQEGLILWAFATGQDESFQSILIKEKHLTKDELLEGIKSARAQGKKNLDEILLALGIENHDSRNNIIERHTRSALKTLQEWDGCQAQFNSTPISVNSGKKGQGLELNLLLANGNGVQANEPVEKVDSSNPVEQVTSTRPSYGSDSRPTAEAKNITEVLERFRYEVPSFVAAMIIDGETGMPIASLSDVEELDLEIVSAFFRNLSKSAMDALQAMGKSSTSNCPLEEILITSEDEYALLRVLKDGKHFLYVSHDKSSNPGMARVAIRRYFDSINTFLA